MKLQDCEYFKLKFLRFAEYCFRYVPDLLDVPNNHDNPDIPKIFGIPDT